MTDLSGNRKTDNATHDDQQAPAAGPRSLTRVLGLFGILAENSDGMTLAEISDALESPKSSLLNLCRPLVTENYLCHIGGHYKLGPAIYRLSSKIMTSWNFSGMFHPYVEKLAKATQETAYLGVLDKEAKLITYVDAIDSRQSIRYPITVGTTRPLYCTAAGRILLAYEDQDWVNTYLKTVNIEPITDNTITDRRQLKKILNEVKETGISISFGELFDELGAIAAPIFGANDKVIASLALGCPLEKLRKQLPELQALITELAHKASGLPVD